MSFFRFLSAAMVSALILSACNSNEPASKSAAPAKMENKAEGKALSADNWCERYPKSAVCKDEARDQWCEANPSSAICPEAIAKAEQRTQWCNDYPASAICK